MSTPAFLQVNEKTIIHSMNIASCMYLCNSLGKMSL